MKGKIKIFNCAGFASSNTEKLVAFEKEINEFLSYDKMDGWKVIQRNVNTMCNFWGESEMTVTLWLEKS